MTTTTTNKGTTMKTTKNSNLTRPGEWVVTVSGTWLYKGTQSECQQMAEGMNCRIMTGDPKAVVESAR